MTSQASDEDSHWAFRLTAFVDGEVDAAQAAATEAHLSTCRTCQAAVRSVQSVRQTLVQDGVSYAMPPRVRAQILDALDKEVSGAWRSSPADLGAKLFAWVRRWSLVPSAIALAASLLLVMAPPPAGQPLQDQVLASHIHSLLADHLTDVVSTDQHTVKPWFNGKADFSPPVVDLAAQGFPLVGGRLDYIGGRTVATAVYRRRGHVINLFMWPAEEIGVPASGRRGYTILSWTANGTTYCAVSDVSTQDLQALRQDLLQAKG